jgi:hypothetical protein
MYHNHPCVPARRNEHLWNKYIMPRETMIGFCFTCGRAGSGRDGAHGHFPLTAYNAPNGGLLPIRGSHYSYECASHGGGNRRELFARILAIIKKLNERDINSDEPIYDNKEFITALSKAAEEGAGNDVLLREADAILARPAAERQFPRIKDIVFSEEQQVQQANGCPPGHAPAEMVGNVSDHEGGLNCMLCELEGERDTTKSIYRLKHNTRNGELRAHTNDELICIDHLRTHLRFKLAEASNACFVPSASGCGGTIHPCEIERILDTPANRGIIQGLRGRVGGRRKTRRRKIQKKARKHTYKKLKRQLKR